MIHWLEKFIGFYYKIIPPYTIQDVIDKLVFRNGLAVWNESESKNNFKRSSRTEVCS